jgi:hypothetical protein
MNPEINQPTVYASPAWNAMVAQMSGMPHTFPQHRDALTVIRPWSMNTREAREAGPSSDELFETVFGA